MASGFGVQGVLVAAGAFVVGIVVGGFGPRAEVRELEEKVFELQRGKVRGGGTSGGEELARLITEGLESKEDAAASGGAGDTDAPGVPRVGPDGRPLPDEAGPLGPDGKPQDPLVAAREVLELRRTQARAALAEDADPSGEQLDVVDRLVAEMNTQLEALAHDFVAEVGAGKEPSRRQMMTTGADVLDLLASTEDQILQTFTPEQRASLREEATDPTSYIDPKVVEILAGLAGQDER